MDSIFRREIFFFQELPPFRLVYVTQPLRLRQQPPLFGQIRCYLLFSSSSLQQQCSKQCSRGDAQIRSFRVSELWLTSFFHKRWAGHLSIYFLRCLTEFFQRLEKKRSLPCGFPQPRKSSNSEVNRITIKFLRCNYHEREIAGETISFTLCIKSLILFLKSTPPLPYFSFSLPSSLRIWITRNRHTSLVVHANADVRFDKSASKSNRYHSPPPSPIRLEIYSNTRPSFPINETEGITSAYIADYSRLRGEKNNLGFVLHFRGPSTLPPFSSPFGILGAKIFYNNNDRRNSKNAIHGIFHTIPV